MSFALLYGRGKNVGRQTLTDPSPEMIEEAINELLPALDYFVVLESNPPIKNIAYVQTAIKNDNNDKPEIMYIIEVNEKTDDSFIQYRRYAEDANEVKKLFRMFALGIIPDISEWENVTEEIKNLPEIETKWRKALEKSK